LSGCLSLLLNNLKMCAHPRVLISAVEGVEVCICFVHVCVGVCIYVLVYLSCLSPFYFSVYTTRDVRPLEEMLVSVGNGGLRYLGGPGPL
jgi:hypothetical protein